MDIRISEMDKNVEYKLKCFMEYNFRRQNRLDRSNMKEYRYINHLQKGTCKNLSYMKHYTLCHTYFISY